MTNSALINAIVAMDENRVIGYKNQLPWHMPADLKHFKTLTTNNIILMGRKTYDSIGKPLPNRINLIMSKDVSFKAQGCTTITSVTEGLNFAEQSDKKLFVIGGAEIFKLWLPYVQKIYLTIIHHSFVGDTFFPQLDPRIWQEVKNENFSADEKNLYSYSFTVLQRVSQEILKRF